MRTLRTVLTFLMLLSIIIACKHTEEPKPEIVVAEESKEVLTSGITFDSGVDSESQSSQEVQTKTFSFKATDNWSASITETKATTWITLDPASGGAGEVTIAITVQPNTGEEDRTVTITIVCGEATITFTVTQEGVAASEPQFLTFRSEGTTEISLHNENGNAPIVYYSYDKVNWEQWDYSPLQFSKDSPLYMYGDNETFSTRWAKLNGDFSTFEADGDNFGVDGNIMCLLSKSGNINTVPPGCFSALFKGCTRLKTPPELPAEILSERCYELLFYGCHSLIEVPELPAETLAYRCYYSMFSGCTSLTTAPELPAETLANMCYDSMFSGCTSFTTAPELPATSLADSCYCEMFRACDNLTEAPTLPAVVLSDGCYAGMFADCTSLISAPDLPATNLTNRCYYSMFYNCTSLTAAPELPATTLAGYCYGQMFCFCSGLNEAPFLPAVVLSECCYWEMFAYCTSLTSAPDLPATTLTDRCYESMFYNCTSLTAAPELPATNLAPNCYSGMFSECVNLVVAPELPATDLAESCYGARYLKNSRYAWSKGMFEGCTSLVAAPSLPARNLAKACYNRMFRGCTRLTEAPELPAVEMADRCYSGMFSDCTGLTEAPKLRATVLATSCFGYHFLDYPINGSIIYGYGMFEGCSSLVIAPDLTPTTLAEACYSGMFKDCTSLVEAPALPAQTLVEYCYSDMFSGCVNLVVAPELPARRLKEHCYEKMFYGCSSLNYVKCLATNISANSSHNDWLYNVASSGIFAEPRYMMKGWSKWPGGASGIPHGWEIEETLIPDDDVPPYLTIGDEQYRVKKMGDGRWWMVDNLRYVPEGITVGDGISGIWYPCSDTALEPDESTEGVISKGLLYSDAVAFNAKITKITAKRQEGAQGICPEGWHIPALEEFMALVGKCQNTRVPVVEDSPYYDASRDCGSLPMLKAAGFVGSEAGYIQGSGSGYANGFSNQGYLASMGYVTTTYFFCSTHYSEQMWYALILDEVNNQANVGYMNNWVSSSPIAGCIRCIKDI